MPSPDNAQRPADAVAVARRYRRRERPLSALVAAAAVAAFLGAFLSTSLLSALAVAAVLVVGLRAPVLRPHGTTRLRTDHHHETVRAEFAGPTPPVLALQWGIADDVTAEDGAATYTTSYLFGLRSVDVTVRTDVSSSADGADRIELQATTNGKQWATYAATVRPDGDQTVVDVAYAADRRFGLRRLPQELVAHRYRDAALEAQGYAVVERESRRW